jgi:hypothetical protein
VINLIKLCVGAESLEQLLTFQKHRLATYGEVFHTTRMFPKREAELLNGGSLYWIIKGQIAARQKILALKEIRDDEGKKYCNIMLLPEVIKTQLQAHRPFQGWRYLAAQDAPVDAFSVEGEREKELAALGLI